MFNRISTTGRRTDGRTDGRTDSRILHTRNFLGSCLDPALYLISLELRTNWSLESLDSFPSIFSNPLFMLHVNHPWGNHCVISTQLLSHHTDLSCSVFESLDPKFYQAHLFSRRSLGNPFLSTQHCRIPTTNTCFKEGDAVRDSGRN